MPDTKEIKEEELKKVSGGLFAGTFEESTQILVDCKNTISQLIVQYPSLSKVEEYIDKAIEEQSNLTIRKSYVEDAIEELQKTGNFPLKTIINSYLKQVDNMLN